MPTESIIRVGGKDITIRRLLLRGWSELEELKQAMDDAISKKDFNEYFSKCVHFTEMASVQSVEWDKLPWWEFLTAYAEIVKLNVPTKNFPILTESKQGKDIKKLPWEYPGRGWYFWLNLFASNYGWDEMPIAEMDIDTAIGLYQEIVMDEQFQREFQWGMSEIAYPYNTSTKTQNYKPLERPTWMLPLAPKHNPVVKMRKDMLPVGNIIRAKQ
jgi:hypothetical protein